MVLLCETPPYVHAQQSSPQTPQSTQRKYLVEGSQALDHGHLALAEKQFRHALSLDPNSCGALNDLAISLVRQHRITEAIVYYHRAMAICPKNPATRLNLGIAYFLSHRYHHALPLLKPLADSQKDNFQMNDLAGLTLFALDRYREAVVYLERASHAQPKNLNTLYMAAQADLRIGNYTGLTKIFARIMAVNPNSPEAHILMGIAYDKRDMYEKALPEYLAAEKAAPNFPGVHSGLGQIYWSLGKMGPAETEFESELKRFPSDTISNCMLGEILMRKAQPQEAAKHFKIALAANPRYKDALLGLGNAEIQMNHPHRAKALLERAVKLYPNSAKGHYELGNALALLGQKKAAEHEHTLSSKIQADRQAHYTRELNSHLPR